MSPARSTDGHRGEKTVSGVVDFGYGRLRYSETWVSIRQPPSESGEEDNEIVANDDEPPEKNYTPSE